MERRLGGHSARSPVRNACAGRPGRSAGLSPRAAFGNDGGRPRFLGNILIAIGALLPGIGGTATRFGHVEVLYITEFVGLIFIYLGYRMMRQDHSASVHANQQTWEGSPSPVDPRAT